MAGTVVVTGDKFRSKVNRNFSAAELKVQLRTQIPDRELQAWLRAASMIQLHQ